MPCSRRYSFTAASSFLPSLFFSSRWRNLQMVVSSGAASEPRSMPAKARIAAESYSASSTAGSERLNHSCRKYTRSMRSSGSGGRPPCSLTFGYTGSTTAASSRHGTVRSISLRNCARRVVFPYFSNPVSVCCFIEEPA